MSETITTAATLAATTATAVPETHTVTVGVPGKHRFNPETLSANIGDIVVFEFMPTNHSVIRSTWESPCIPYDTSLHASKKKLDAQGTIWIPSVMVDAEDVQPELPWESIPIKISDPIYIYCGQPHACIDWGMVMIINPFSVSSRGIEGFREAAHHEQYILQPGEPIPVEEGGHIFGTAPQSAPTSFYTSASSPLPSTSSATPLPTAAAIAAPPTHTSINTGTLAGVVVGGAAVLAIIGLLCYLLLSRRRGKRHALAAPGEMSDGRSPTFSQQQTIVIPMGDAEKAIFVERSGRIPGNGGGGGHYTNELDGHQLYNYNTGTVGTVGSTASAGVRSNITSDMPSPREHLPYELSSPAEMDYQGQEQYDRSSTIQGPYHDEKLKHSYY